jgi:SusD family.
MKRIIYFIALSTLVCGVSTISGCKKNYLEKPFGVSFNEDSVFARYENAQKLVFDMYAHRPYYLFLNLGSGNGARLQGSLLECATDFGCSFRLQPAYGTHKFNAGTVDAEWLSNNPLGEDVYGNHYKTIRIAFTLLERIDEVPDAPASVKERIKAEAQTMIALEYFRLMFRYGGVPLVKSRLNPGEDEVNLPRSPLADVYNYIIEMLDAAIANPGFAARYDGLEFGRLNKAFAYGLKARAALWVASPLFNTATPYMDLPGHNDLICMTNYDPQRWQVAAQYAGEAINYCETNGYAIVNTPDVNLNYTISYQYRPNQGNTEAIWATMQETNPPMTTWNPRGAPFSGHMANMPTLNLVAKYQNRDGSYVDWDQPVVTPPNDPTYPYKNLDPRFNQTVMYNGLEVYPGAFFDNYDGETAALHGKNGPAKTSSQFAHLVRKHVFGYEDRAITKKTWQPLCMQMRLTDLYMTYAEALNESLPAPDDRVLTKINAIRARSGMPGIPAGLSKDEMRTRIQDEWAIEFAFEDYRFFDLKRWKMGDVFKGPIYDLRVIKKTDNSFVYTKYKYEDRPFFEWYYLHAFPPSEVNLKYGLVQNPGW